MKCLLLTVLTLATAPTFAAPVILKNSVAPAQALVHMKLSANAAATVSYSKKSSRTFSALRSRAIATGSMTITMDGHTKSQDVPSQNSDSEAKGELKILNDGEVELSNDGGSAKMNAAIVRNADGSLKSLMVSDKEMVKAIKTIIASSQGDQIRALQGNPALIKAVIELSSMTCTATTSGLSCSQSMKVSMEMAQ